MLLDFSKKSGVVVNGDPIQELEQDVSVDPLHRNHLELFSIPLPFHQFSGCGCEPVWQLADTGRH